jgi:hypothetical protein
MSAEAKVSMMLNWGLEPAEREKVERLDGPISVAFIRAGRVVRCCQGRITGDRRALDFTGPTGTVSSVSSDDFMSATDEAAVALVTRALQ